MLNRYMDDLKNTIQWASVEDDIDVLCLARQRMDRLMDFVQGLPESVQQDVYRRIDRELPMEWPLWMEACRYGDAGAAEDAVTLH